MNNNATFRIAIIYGLFVMAMTAICVHALCHSGDPHQYQSKEWKR